MLGLIRGEHCGPHVLRYVIDFQSAMLCINIGYRFHNVLRKGMEMARFHGLCDGKRMIRKRKRLVFFAKNSGGLCNW